MISQLYLQGQGVLDKSISIYTGVIIQTCAIGWDFWTVRLHYFNIGAILIFLAGLGFLFAYGGILGILRCGW